MEEKGLIRVKVFSRTLHIGTAELRDTLGGMGTMYGKFSPNENYSQVKKQIQENNDFKPHQSITEWHYLRFNAQLESGYFLFAIGDFSIDDFVEFQEEQLTLQLAGVLPCVFEYHRNEDPVDLRVKERDFLSEPWQKITIEEKIAFEDELEKEIGLPRLYNKEIWNTPNNHPLAQTEFSALAKNTLTNEVIFSIHGKPTIIRENREIAAFITVVNLTWSGKKEFGNLPQIKFYHDLDEL